MNEVSFAGLPLPAAQAIAYNRFAHLMASTEGNAWQGGERNPATSIRFFRDSDLLWLPTAQDVHFNTPTCPND